MFDFSVDTVVVTAAQMQQIENRLFEAGMPVAALMEKVGQRLTAQISAQYPREQFATVALLVGPGHNGGDGLVVARELFLRGYQVKVFQPLNQAKALTQAHKNYAQHLDLPFVQTVDAFLDADLIVDSLFGFGLTRPITGGIAADIQRINDSGIPVVSIDLPSGIHTDTGEVMGIAIAAQRTYCLGLWKQGLFQDRALASVGKAELIDIGITPPDIHAVIEQPIQCISPSLVQTCLPLNRPVTGHKYQMGSLLLVCGSSKFPGAAILSAKGASESGVGMLFVAVPESLKMMLVEQVPHAVVIGCPETPTGAIANLPADLDMARFDAIAIGPGLTLEAAPTLDSLWAMDCPLLLDADALNALASLNVQERLASRVAATILTPHQGEFNRLFPGIWQTRDSDSIATSWFESLSQLAIKMQTIIVLKGARTIVASPDFLWVNPAATPALARGGSGDVLTGILGGLLAQSQLTGQPAEAIAAASVWIHAQAGCFQENIRSPMGVDPTRLVQGLNTVMMGVYEGEKTNQEI